jgi:hypothetical protein
MSHVENSFYSGSTRVGPLSLGKLQTKVVCPGLTVKALIDRCDFVTDPQGAGDSKGGPQVEPVPALQTKAYPVHMVRQVMRNSNVGGSAADLRLLRAKNWSN